MNPLEYAIESMQWAILNGVVIPTEFAPFVRQYLPGLLPQAQFAEREGLINRAINPVPKPDTSPDRNVQRTLPSAGGSGPATQIPNVFRGALDPSGLVDEFGPDFRRNWPPDSPRGLLDSRIQPAIPFDDPEWYRREI